MPTIAIIGGGTGGHLLAARLLESASDGQRLHVTLIEGRGRAGQHLRRIVREAERTAPGAFLTRVRGEAASLSLISGHLAVRIGLRSGRVLDVDRAVLVIGSVAADGLGVTAREPPALETLPSEADIGTLRPLADAVADRLLAGLRDRESAA